MKSISFKFQYIISIIYGHLKILLHYSNIAQKKYFKNEKHIALYD